MGEGALCPDTWKVLARETPVTACDDPPAGLGAGGQVLWRSLLEQDVALQDVQSPSRVVAEEACRTKDRCDALDDVCRSQPAMLTTEKGVPVAHPAWVEARQQATVLKQLVAALRLPDSVTGRRPQRRGTGPGAYGQGAVASGPVSSLDRARMSAKDRLRAGSPDAS